MERTANMVQSFKQVSVVQSTSQQRRFKLNGTITCESELNKGTNFRIVMSLK